MPATTHDTPAKPTPPGDPVLPEISVNLVRPTDPAIGRVVANELCTKGGRKASGFIRHVAIDVSGTPLEAGFVAGQSFGVLPPGEDAKGKPHKLRLYSIASPTRGEDGEGAVLSTTVKRVVDEHWDDHGLFTGVCSNYLCDTQVGDEVRVTGPSGKRFVLPADPSAHDFVFFATGTGIAPFRAMILDLLESGVPSRVALVMGVPYTTDLIYDDDFRDLEERTRTSATSPRSAASPRATRTGSSMSRSGSAATRWATRRARCPRCSPTGARWCMSAASRAWNSASSGRSTRRWAATAPPRSSRSTTRSHRIRRPGTAG
jgi:ferredoxin-NADP reductase